MLKVILIIALCSLVLGLMGCAAETNQRLMALGNYMQTLGPPPPQAPPQVWCVNCR